MSDAPSTRGESNPNASEAEPPKPDVLVKAPEGTLCDGTIDDIIATAPDAILKFLDWAMEWSQRPKDPNTAEPSVLKVLMEKAQHIAREKRKEEERAAVGRAEEQRRIQNELSRSLRIFYANLDAGDKHRCRCAKDKVEQITAHLTMDTLQQFDVLVFAELTNVGARTYIKCCEGDFTEVVSSTDTNEVSIYVRKGLIATNPVSNPRSATVTVTKEGELTTITGVHWMKINPDDNVHRATIDATFATKNPRWVIVGDFNETRGNILGNFDQKLQSSPKFIEVPTSAGNYIDHVFASPCFRSDQEGPRRCTVIDRYHLYTRTEEGGPRYCFNHPMLEVRIPLTTLRIFYANLMSREYTHRCSCGKYRFGAPGEECKEKEAHLDPRTLQQFDVLVLAELTNADELNYFSNNCGFRLEAFSPDRPLPMLNNAVRIYVRNSRHLQVTDHPSSTGSATVTVRKGGVSTTITGVHWGTTPRYSDLRPTFEATFGNDRNARTSRWVIVGDFHEKDLWYYRQEFDPQLSWENQWNLSRIFNIPTFYLFISPVIPREGYECCKVNDLYNYKLRRPVGREKCHVYCFHPSMFEVQVPLIDVPKTAAPSGGIPPTSSVAKPKT